jgi:large subunit ribosomal protein L4
MTLRKSDGSGAGSVALSERLFGATVKKGLIHQAVRLEMTNSRQGTQSTKTRGTVHHTTRKPYKQKGTGRARQGMTSAPHYRHGGIAMGPLPRDSTRTMPKKMRRAASASALSGKFADNQIIVIESLAMDVISTKTAAKTLIALGVTTKNVLIVIPEHSPVIYKSFRNIPGVETRVAPAFSARDVMKANTLIFTQDALNKMESVWNSGGDEAAPETAEPETAEPESAMHIPTETETLEGAGA